MTRTLFLDMDGVVADFNAYARRVLKVRHDTEKWPEHEFARLKENPRLYRDLNKTPYADVLVAACRGICTANEWQLLFLTAVPHKNDMPWSFYDKVMWGQKHFPDIPVHFGPFSADKHVHATPGDILIDDRTVNIRDWTAAGGVGILHKSIDDTLVQLFEAVAQ